MNSNIEVIDPANTAGLSKGEVLVQRGVYPVSGHLCKSILVIERDFVGKNIPTKVVGSLDG